MHKQHYTQSLIGQIESKSNQVGSLIDALNAANDELTKLQKELGAGFTNEDCLYLSLLITFSLTNDTVTPMVDFSNHIGCKPVELIGAVKSLHKMAEIGMIESSKKFTHQNAAMNAINFALSNAQLTAILSGQSIKKAGAAKSKSNLSLLEKIKKLFKERIHKKMPFELFRRKLLKLIKQHKDIKLVQDMELMIKTHFDASYQTLADLNVHDSAFNEFILTWMLLTQSGLTGLAFDWESTIENVFDYELTDEKFLFALLTETHAVFKSELAKIQSELFMQDVKCMVATKLFYKALSIETKVEEKKERDQRYFQIVNASSIQPKELFFENELKSQTKKLLQLCSDDVFEQQLPQVLTKYKSKAGFCAVLSGAPGTGKTEFVYQLAKQTQRPIFKIEASQLISKYMGDSEKTIRKVFQDYTHFCEENKRHALLLLNEGDSIISKRIAVEKSIDQSNNSMQNILLEELENFSGIMFVTTNMIKNFDPAFERRFLFKLKFGMPSAKIQQIIWQENFPQLSEKEAAHLSAKFKLSPAQIANIAKLVVFEEVTGKKFSMDLLVEFANLELSVQARKFIGFAA
jgi:SpoVK/Ycf46/Vps4 family AAA+-type ATPase